MFSSTKNSAPFWHPPKPNLGDIASHPFGSYPKPQISDLVVLAVNPFGSILSSVSKGVYRYGFNGKETDGETDLQDYGMRIYNKAYGKFLSEDPMHSEFPWNSPYSFAENDVIRCIDLDGLEKVALSGFVPSNQYGKGNTYNATNVRMFKEQGVRLYKQYGVHNHQVSTGQDIIKTFTNETRNHGSISFVASFSHSGPNGLYMINGDGFYFSHVDQIKELINKGEIKFKSEAVWFINGCNSANSAIGNALGTASPYNLAKKITLETGVTTIGAIGKMEMMDPKNANGVFKIADKDNESFNQFYKFERIKMTFTETIRIKNPEYSWWKFWSNEPEYVDKEVEKEKWEIKVSPLGREVKIDDYVPKD
jgi:RHS repeat-associated protein